MDELGGNILHDFHVVGKGGGGRPNVAAGGEAGAECVQAGGFEGGDEECPGGGEEVAAMDDKDGGFGGGHGCQEIMGRTRGGFCISVGLHGALNAGLWI